MKIEIHEYKLNTLSPVPMMAVEQSLKSSWRDEVNKGRPEYMKINIVRINKRIVWIVSAILFVLAGCGNSSHEHAASTEPGYGSVGFDVRWLRSGNTPKNRHIAKMDCARVGVYKVEIQICDQNNSYLAGTEMPLDCQLGQAAIENVPAGLNRVIHFLGRDEHDEIIYRGSLPGVIVNAGDVTHAGEIEVAPFAPTVNPVDDETSLKTGEFELTWPVVAGAVSYHIQISGDSRFEETIVDERVTSTSYSHVFSVNGDYYWRVQAIDTLGYAGAWVQDVHRTQIQCVIEASATEGGTISPTGLSHVAYGGTATYTMTPSEGFKLSHLIVDSQYKYDVNPDGDQFQFDNVAEAHRIRAFFEANVYNIDVIIEGEGETRLQGEAIHSGVIEVRHGDTLDFTFKPNDGYVFGALVVGSDRINVISAGMDFRTEQILGPLSIVVSFEQRTAIVSDDFTQGLNTDVWTFYDPLGDSKVSVLEDVTGHAQLRIWLPPEVSHDAWESNDAARLMQSVPDKDFDLTVKFDSPVTERYTSQGIIVEESDSNWLRFDILCTGNELFMYSASIVDHTPTELIKYRIPTSTEAPFYLYVKRSGDLWTFSYSLNNVDWTSCGEFSHVMELSSIGPFACNYNINNSPVPDLEVLVDFFYTTAILMDSENQMIQGRPLKE